MPNELSFADVAEGVRATIAAYTQALDDGRTDDVVATFCPDGLIYLPGMGTHEGHDALRTAYAGWAPRRPQRHLVLNTHVSDWSDDEATAVSDVIFILLAIDSLVERAGPEVVQEHWDGPGDLLALIREVLGVTRSIIPNKLTRALDRISG